MLHQQFLIRIHNYLKIIVIKIKAPYMITAFEATKLGVFKTALHQADHTLRPQVLEYNANLVIID